MSQINSSFNSHEENVPHNAEVSDIHHASDPDITQPQNEDPTDAILQGRPSTLLLDDLNQAGLRILIENVTFTWSQGSGETVSGNIASKRWELSKAIWKPTNGGIDVEANSSESIAITEWTSTDNSLVQLLDANPYILLLGDHGAGKTTQLVELTKVRLDQYAPDEAIQTAVPVMLTLANWSGTNESLPEWCIEELRLRYAIPKRLGHVWFENQYIVPLFDDLEMLHGDLLASFLKELKRCNQDKLFPAWVLCCETETYASLPEEIDCSAKVRLLGLRPDQIVTYASKDEAQSRRLHELLDSHRLWEATLQTPLMLTMANALMQSDQEVQGLTATPIDTVHEGQQRLLQTYVNYLVHLSTDSQSIAQRNRIMKHLTWLAIQMEQNRQNVFSIGQLQPTWLPGRISRLIYMLVSRFASWFLWSIIPALVIGLVIGINWNINDGLFWGIGSWAIIFVLCGLLTGIVAWLQLEINLHRVKPRRAKGWRSRIRPGTWMLYFSSSLAGITIGISVSVYFGPILGFTFGLALALLVARSMVNRRGYQRMAKDILIFDPLQWSWRRFQKGVRKGAKWGGIVGLIALMLFVPIFGIYRALANGIFAAVLLAGAIAMIFAIIFGIEEGLKSQPEPLRRKTRRYVGVTFMNILRTSGIVGITAALTYGVLITPRIGLLVGITLALASALSFGGIDLIYHATLRILLLVRGKITIRYHRFLEDATKHRLLMKVGNDYLFPHYLIQQYFAAMKLPTKANSL